MKKNIIILLFASVLILIGFQNCGDIKLNPIQNTSLSCIPQVLAIETDNTSSSIVRFLVRDLENFNSVSSQNFNWTLSENRTELYTEESSEINIEKSTLVACHTYQVRATFENCGEEETLSVDYTLDGPDCEPPVEDPPPPPPPDYPPPNPAPPGQQTVGMGCSLYGGNPNAQFDYSKAKYCLADTSPTNTSALMQCRNSGIDFSTSNQRYYPIIKAGQYIAIEVTLPHPFTNGISKTICGFSMMGEAGGNPCGGTPAAVEKWSLSPNPGDFNPPGAGCVSYTNAGGMRGQVKTTPEIGGCTMDPGRKYYLNIKMGQNCTDPNGCVFLLMTGTIYSGRPYIINGQRYTTDLSCQLVPD